MTTILLPTPDKFTTTINNPPMTMRPGMTLVYEDKENDEVANVNAESGLSSRAELAACFLEDAFPSKAIRNGNPAIAAAPADGNFPIIQHMSEIGSENVT